MSTETNLKSDQTIGPNPPIKIKQKKKISGWPLVLGYISIFAFIAGILCCLPTIIIPFFKQETFRLWAFLIPGLCAIALGIPGLILVKKYKTTTLGKNFEFLLLILVWILSIIINAIPYMLPETIGGLGLTFTESIFETVSGLTTTGLTILPRHAVDGLSPSILLATNGHTFLFHRALMTFFGGIGFVLVIACAFSNKFGNSLYYSEGHSEKFLSSVAKSARLVFAMYTFIVIIGAILLYVCGMNEWTPYELAGEAQPTFFDAITISMSCVSTAGFCVRDTSIFFYNSIGIEIVMIVLMFIASTNFLVIYNICRFKFKKGFKDGEFKFSIIFTLIFLPLLFLTFYFSKATPTVNIVVDGAIMNGNLLYQTDALDTFRRSAFTFFSAVSTTGFDITPNIALTTSSLTSFIMVIIMITGGATGSTAGGVKRYRLIVSLKGLYWSLKDLVSNKNIRKMYPKTISRFGEKQTVTDTEVKSCIYYIILYVSLILFCAIIISFNTPSEFTFGAALFESASAITSAGFSTGIVSVANDGVLWILLILMFIGRLEIYSFILSGNGILNLFRRKKEA